MSLDLPEVESQAFEKLLTVVPNDIFIYQIANLFEQNYELNLATKWFNVVSTHFPTYPGISQLGKIFSKKEDDPQEFNDHIESFQNWPVYLDVISCCGVLFFKNEMYENSSNLFELAEKIHPNELNGDDIPPIQAML